MSAATEEFDEFDQVNIISAFNIFQFVQKTLLKIFILEGFFSMFPIELKMLFLDTKHQNAFSTCGDNIFLDRFSKSSATVEV